MSDIQTATNALGAIVQIVYLDDTNAVFSEHNSCLSLKATIPNEDGTPEEKQFDRVFLHCAFPFDMPEEYISVLDNDQKEIGMIRSLSAVSTETQAVLRNELRRKYYAPKIRKIFSVKERYGFSYWNVALETAETFSFTVQDTYRSMLKVEGGRVFVIDVDGNRFEIENVEALDKKSYKRIELYL